MGRNAVQGQERSPISVLIESVYGLPITGSEPYYLSLTAQA